MCLPACMSVWVCVHVCVRDTWAVRIVKQTKDEWGKEQKKKGKAKDYGNMKTTKTEIDYTNIYR